MAPCPQYVKSVSVTAHYAQVTVTARYQHPDGGDDILETVTLAVGETHTFPEKIQNMGTWDAVCPIHTLSGKIGDGEFTKTTKEDCGGIENHIGYSLHSGGLVKVKGEEVSLN